MSKNLKKDILAIITEATDVVTRPESTPEFDELQSKAVTKPTDKGSDYAKGVKGKAPKRRADKDTGLDSDGAKDNKGKVTFDDIKEGAIEDDVDDDEKDEESSKDGDKKKKENPFDKFKKKKKSVKEEKDKEDEEDEEDMAENISFLFAGEELTETFKKKAVVVFETAVNLRVDQKVVELEEAFEARLAEETKTIEEALETKVDGFLSYVTEQWVTDHNLELENGIRTEIAESFIAGLKSLFEQHSIEIPATKVDVVEKLSEELAKTKSALNAQLRTNANIQESLNVETRKSIIRESLKDLPASQADKLRTLSESLSFKDETSFTESLTVLKETYAGTSTSKTKNSQQLTEELTNDDVVVPTGGLMDIYNKTISRHNQK